MVWLNSNRTRLAVIGIVAAAVLGGGRANAMIIMGEPASVGSVINDNTDVQKCDFSHDGLELYYASQRPGGYGRNDIWVAKRETLNSPWQEPVNLGPAVNSAAGEVEPSISSDGLELYFACWADFMLRMCTRPSKDAPWSSPVKIGPPVGTYDTLGPDISADGLSLYFASRRNGGYGSWDLWVASRPTKDDLWGEPVNLGPNVNTSGNEWALSVSADGRTLVFSRGFSTMWATTRKSVNDEWEPAVMLPFDNPPGNFHSPAFSPDGSTLYFNVASAWGTLGANDIWQVKFIPIVDLNGDSIVDAEDTCVMIDHWGENYSLCDIGPMPWGDGIVDVEDLIVLSEHLFEQVDDPTLAAHWALDETEGATAFDSVSGNCDIVMGAALWQPTGGKVNGALELDGVDDCIITTFSLNPADGPFSISAWVKGGAPGQVVMSEPQGVNWLMVDAEGKLMTELKSASRNAAALQSQTVITDGAWHRIGLVWDGSQRTLCVDGVAVAEDTQDSLETFDTGLCIGAGNDYAPGSLFYGFIDDVRVYSRAVSP